MPVGPQGKVLLPARLAIKRMVEVGLRMDLAVMNMNSREKEAFGVASGKRERHGMDCCRSGFQLEDGETKRFIIGQFFPCSRGETKPFIEPGEVSDGGHERSLE